ncbi:MAG: hypothetical protein IPK50_14060 [Fibrobacterota bacterium]|nr:hypothetical protein [Fibrobacterota bacterium]QQS03425.1 MAG: hypothetical protein IPK50_14060 [Fibrobacterota bacterium]
MAFRIVAVVFSLAVAAIAAPQQGPAPAVVVKATYFHADYRCPSCLKLERWSSIAIQRDLADSMKTGRLIWGTLNMDVPEGAALADKFGLTNKALVLMEMRGGKLTRFKELKETWKNLRDSAAFAAYVKTETVAFLKEAR